LTTGRCPKSTSGHWRSLWGAVKWHITHTHTSTCCPLPLLLSFFAFIHTHIDREKAWWVCCLLHWVSEFFYALQLFCRVRYLAYLYSAVISLFNLVFKFFLGVVGSEGLVFDIPGISGLVVLLWLSVKRLKDGCLLMMGQNSFDWEEKTGQHCLCSSYTSKNKICAKWWPYLASFHN
jgi:hypothetical protein